VDARPQQSWWARAGAALRFVETALLGVLLAGLVVFASAQIVLRNFFSMGVSWGDGLIRLSVLWLALLGALAASSEERHITLGALVRWLPPGGQRMAAALADLFAAAVCGALAWFSASFVADSRAAGDTLLNGIKAWPMQSIMPVAFALIAVRFAWQSARHLRGS
jgi:TRAP-type C4-dicarboxylate transport system permease small subunit